MLTCFYIIFSIIKFPDFFLIVKMRMLLKKKINLFYFDLESESFQKVLRNKKFLLLFCLEEVENQCALLSFSNKDVKSIN
jgi:hypothetical protein